MTNGIDYAKDFIKTLFYLTEGPPFPPYLLEITLKDGCSFYIYRANMYDEDSESLVLDVYDFRALSSEDELEIQHKLNEIHWNENSSLYDLHPLLDYGHLRISLNEIRYVVEWHRHRHWRKLEYKNLPPKLKGLLDIN